MKMELTKSPEEKDCPNLQKLSELPDVTRSILELSFKFAKVVNYTENGSSSQNHPKTMIVRLCPNGNEWITEVSKSVSRRKNTVRITRCHTKFTGIEPEVRWSYVNITENGPNLLNHPKRMIVRICPSGKLTEATKTDSGQSIAGRNLQVYPKLLIELKMGRAYKIIRRERIIVRSCPNETL